MIRQSTVYRKAELLKALRNCLGIVSEACRLCEFDRSKFYKICKADPKFKKTVEYIKRESCDKVEDLLFKLIENGNIEALIFYLNCQAKDRGYGKPPRIKAPVHREPINTPLMVVKSSN